MMLVPGAAVTPHRAAPWVRRETAVATVNRGADVRSGRRCFGHRSAGGEEPGDQSVFHGVKLVEVASHVQRRGVNASRRPEGPGLRGLCGLGI